MNSFKLPIIKIKKMKRLIALLVVLVAVSLSTTAQTFTPATIKLTKKDKQNSSLFQSLKGSDRTAVYNKLHNLIRIQDASNTAKSASVLMGSKTSTLGEVIALLGQPDASIKESFLQYNLTANATKRVIIGINKTGTVSYCTIKN